MASNTITNLTSPIAASYNVGSTSFNITSSQSTIIYGTLLFDTNNIYDGTTGTGTIPQSGIYEIGATLFFNGGTTGGRALYLVVNGVTVALIADQNGIVGGTAVDNSLLWDFNKGDTFQIQATQGGGGTIATLGDGQVEYFFISLLR